MDFKVGEFAVASETSEENSITKGNRYEVLENDNQGYLWITADDGTKTWVCDFRFHAPNTITIGTRVTARDGEIAGVVVAEIPSVSVKWDATGNTNNWAVADLAVEVGNVPESRGNIIQELRKAAGLPEFVVGDVVKIKDEFGGWKATVTDIGDGRFKLQSGGVSVWYNNLHEFSVVTPANTTTATAEQPQELKYNKGDYVRFVDGEFKDRAAYIEDVDVYAPEYLVTMIDEDDGDWATANQLEPWQPRVGDRVQIKADYSDNSNLRGATGSIIAAICDGYEWTMLLDKDFCYGGHDCDGTTPANRGRWVDTDDIIPIAPEPAAEFKAGDIVEVVKNDDFLGSVKVGDTAIVADARDSDGHWPIYVSTASGVIKQYADNDDIKLAA